MKTKVIGLLMCIALLVASMGAFAASYTGTTTSYTPDGKIRVDSTVTASAAGEVATYLVYEANVQNVTAVEGAQIIWADEHLFARAGESKTFSYVTTVDKVGAPILVGSDATAATGAQHAIPAPCALVTIQCADVVWTEQIPLPESNADGYVEVPFDTVRSIVTGVSVNGASLASDVWFTSASGIWLPASSLKTENGEENLIEVTVTDAPISLSTKYLTYFAADENATDDSQYASFTAVGNVSGDVHEYGILMAHSEEAAKAYINGTDTTKAVLLPAIAKNGDGDFAVRVYDTANFGSNLQIYVMTYYKETESASPVYANTGRFVDLPTPEGFVTLNEESFVSRSDAGATVYAIEQDAYGYPQTLSEVRVGGTGLYILPPGENLKTFSASAEKATITENGVSLTGGLNDAFEYAGRQCKLEWRFSNLDKMTNTYRLTINAQSGNSVAGAAYRFHISKDGAEYYCFTVRDQNHHSSEPAWALMKQNADGTQTTLLQSAQLPTQATTGTGYLKAYTAVIEVTDKETFKVTLNGTTSTGGTIQDVLTAIDDAPFAHNANECYPNVTPQGTGTTTLYSLKMETDLQKSSTGGTENVIDYGTVTTGTTREMSWKAMDKGYLTFVFDDNNEYLPQFYEIITGEYGMPICAAVPTKYIDQNPTTLAAIEASGGEILSHTHSHPQLNFDVAWTDVDYEFSHSKELLENAGYTVRGIITAGGTESDLSKAYRKAVEPIVNKYYDYADHYGVSIQYSKGRDNFSAFTLDELKAMVDRQIRYKTWHVVYAHNFDELPEETLRSLMAYIKEKVDAGQLELVTYSHMFDTFAQYK